MDLADLPFEFQSVCGDINEQWEKNNELGQLSKLTTCPIMVDSTTTKSNVIQSVRMSPDFASLSEKRSWFAKQAAMGQVDGIITFTEPVEYNGKVIISLFYYCGHLCGETFKFEFDYTSRKLLKVCRIND